MEKNKFVLFALMAIASMIAVISVNAAVTGCIANDDTPAAGTAGYPKYNDTGTITNVSVGNVCYTAALYDIAPNASAYCNNSWSNFTNNSCVYWQFYVGFANGTTACAWSVNASLQSPTPYTMGVDSVINETANRPIARVAPWAYWWQDGTRQNTADPFNLTAGLRSINWTGCQNGYTIHGNSGYCDGAGLTGVGINRNDTRVYVGTGKVCANDSAVAAGSLSPAAFNNTPSSTKKCATWINCTSGSDTGLYYYVGYASGGASCDQSFWNATGATYTVPTGQHMNTNTDGSSCVLAGYAYSYTKTDFEPIVTDALGVAGASVISWIDLIITLVVLGFIAGIIIKLVALFR
jgi:hypothetical protein